MTHTDIRFADIQMLRYEVPGFSQLPLRQKLYIYHLAEAALWGRDILWDQNGARNLEVRRLLEDIYLHADVPHEGPDWDAFLTYIRRVWFSNGLHHHYSTDKIQPTFTREFFRTACTSISRYDADIEELIFNPDIMPKRVCQSGDDLILQSASNYYGPGVSQRDAEDFYARLKDTAPDPDRPVMYGMNSRLERHADGHLFERTYCTTGLYGKHLTQIVRCLKEARQYADNKEQQQIIDTLIDFYQTGDLTTFDRYAIQWIHETQGFIDFTNGFTEVYGDPLGLKASWEGYVNYTDLQATHRTRILSQNAQWFEDNSPVDERFKKKECRGVSARVVNAAILGGDLYPSSAIGINLPNSNWIRSEHGSKSVTIGNLTAAYDQAAKGNGFHQEFVHGDDIRRNIDTWGHLCDDLHTDLHECLGHGSGKILPGVDPDALGVYGSTIEEARADLFGLYYIADPQLVLLGLTPHTDSYKGQYYTYIMNGLLTQLVRIQPGCCIEEAHMRNRSLIAHWLLEQSTLRTQGTPAITLSKTDGKTHLTITDYPAVRSLIAELLAEVQRIKSEGDFAAARQLVEDYGVKVDPTLHQEVLARYRSLDIAPYKGFINPIYSLVLDEAGNPTDVLISTIESYDNQMLRYGRDYS